jgi:hypothetical protein
MKFPKNEVKINFKLKTRKFKILKLVTQKTPGNRKIPKIHINPNHSSKPKNVGVGRGTSQLEQLDANWPQAVGRCGKIRVTFFL